MGSPHILAILLLAGGCAFTNPNNTPLIQWAEEKIGGKEGGVGHALLFLPLAVPLGLIDVTISHPIQVIDDSYRDINELIWKNPSGGIATQSFFFTPKLAFTPIAFAFSFLGRSLFNIPEYGAKEDPKRKLINLEQSLKYLQGQLLNTRKARENLEEKIRKIEKEIESLKKKI